MVAGVIAKLVDEEVDDNADIDVDADDTDATAALLVFAADANINTASEGDRTGEAGLVKGTNSHVRCFSREWCASSDAEIKPS